MESTLLKCSEMCRGYKYMTYVERGDRNCACQNECTMVDKDINSDLYIDRGNLFVHLHKSF